MIETLIATLQDRQASSADRIHAARQLGQLRDVRAVEPLIMLLADTETALFGSRVCDAAANALKAIGTAEALAAVEAAQS
jgi:HEAT repeat protein